MSGTAAEVAGEMKARFGPCNRPCIRKTMRVQLFSKSSERWQAIGERACELPKLPDYRSTMI